MSRDKLNELVKDARGDRVEGSRRTLAIWAGIEAFKVGAVEPCPFGTLEPDLVAGYERGVDMARRAQPMDRPVVDLTPSHLRAVAKPPSSNSYAALSAPREEE